VIFSNKNNNYYYFYHYQVFKIKYHNLNTTNVWVLFYVGPPHSIFSIHTTLDQSIITWCLIFQFIFQHHTNVPTITVGWELSCFKYARDKWVRLSFELPPLFTKHCNIKSRYIFKPQSTMNFMHWQILPWEQLNTLITRTAMAPPKRVHYPLNGCNERRR